MQLAQLIWQRLEGLGPTWRGFMNDHEAKLLWLKVPAGEKRFAQAYFQWLNAESPDCRDLILFLHSPFCHLAKF